MKNSRNTRVAGIALAAAVAGTFALTPVQSQAAVKPNDIARGLNQLNSMLDRNLDQVGAAVTKRVRPGSGSVKARYSSGGWTYTAVAYNPGADRVYGISTGEDGKPAGHLLRIKPDIHELADLGPLDLRGINTKDVTSASITPTGTLVLFSGAEFRTIDLSKDDLTNSLFSDKITDARALAVKSGKLSMPSNVSDIGAPGAWASGMDPERTYELYAVSRDRDRMYKWTLDTKTGKVTVDPLTIRPGFSLDGIGDLNYAYTKNDGTFVFADDAAKSIEVRGTEIVASYFGNTVVDNFRELAYLPSGAGYKPVTQFAKPDPLPGEYARDAAAPSSRVNAAEVVRDLERIGDAASNVANAVDKAKASTTATVVGEAAEPTPSETQADLEPLRNDANVLSSDARETTPVTVTSTATPAESRDVLFTVVDKDGYAVSNAEIEIAGTDISGKTDKNGQKSLTLPGEDVVAYVGDEPYVVDAGETRMRVTVLEDAEGTEAESGDASAKPADLTDAVTQDVDVLVTDKHHQGVAGAVISAPSALPGWELKTDQGGLVTIQKSVLEKTTTFTVAYGGSFKEFTVDPAREEQTVRLRDLTVTSATSSSTTTKETKENTERKTVTIGVTVETEGGDPVQNAEVYSVHGLDIQVDGLTNEDGLVMVTIPGNVGNGDEVMLGVRTAPDGYDTVRKNVSRKSDGVTLKLPKSKSTTTKTTKNTPEQVLDVIKQVEPLVAALAGPAALGAGLSKRGTTTKSTTSARSTTLNGKVSTGRTTTAAKSTSKNSAKSTSKSTSKSSTSKSTTSTRDGDLADTGTPMTTVITLGILAMLIGGAYVAMGRRREA